MKKLYLFLMLVFIGSSSFAQSYIDIPELKQVDYKPEQKVWFARYGQFQLNFGYTVEGIASGLPQIDNQDLHIKKMKACLRTAKANGINVAIFPELSMSLEKSKRLALLEFMKEFSAENDMIIVAGTFYDDDDICKNVTVLPAGVCYTYKTRPSIFEASTLGGKGMAFSDTLSLFNTKYGSFLTLVCVDLISDDANYAVRDLANKGLLDMLISIDFNPKSQEFMREASAMAVRHPLFVCITNVGSYGKVVKYTWDGDEYGNTSVFGSVRSSFKEEISKTLPAFYCAEDTVQSSHGARAVTITRPAYKSLLGLVDPGKEALLMYDINLRVIRAPEENNAPDQGYPTIKNIKKIELGGVFDKMPR